MFGQTTHTRQNTIKDFASLQCLKLTETINIFIYPAFFGVPTVCIAEKQPRKFKDSENFIILKY